MREAQSNDRRIMFSEKLYGRERETAELLRVFEEACAGQGSLMLVPGWSGVGKTALVRMLRGPVLERNGFFCQGKFNQLQKNVPYGAVRQALSDLLRQLDVGAQERREQWRRSILEATGDLGRLLVDICPGFGEFLGEQPDVASINPLEARHRFVGLFRSLLQVFSKPDHPLVLFLDDWQWADPASMELVRQLGIGEELRYFLLIAAYRDNEVGEDHPFVKTVRAMGRMETPMSTVAVRPLGKDDVRRFVEESLPEGAGAIPDISALVLEKTGGNPFFMRAFLEYLDEFGVLSHDPDVDHLRRWQKTGLDTLPEDVVRLFSRRLRRASPEARRLLFQAACLGNRFRIDALSLVSGLSREQCLEVLDQEIERGLLLALEEGDGELYQFAHDRIQQAAYSLVASEGVARERLHIGRALLNNQRGDVSEAELFEITEHMNAGLGLMKDTEERVELLKLNVRAARKAMGATAYLAALQFHRVAGGLMEEEKTGAEVWKSHHDLAMRFYLEWAESEFLEGDQSRAEAHVREAMARARTPLQMAEAERVLIVQQTLLARYPEAIAAGREGLEALGITLPEGDYEQARDREIAEVREKVAARPVESFAEMPVMTDPEMRMATQLLITMGPPCYRAHQRLWSVLVPKVVNLILSHGNMPEVGYSHTAFAGLLIWVDDDFDLAGRFTHLADTLMHDTFDTPSELSVFHLMMGSSARHWFHPLARCSRDYADAYEIGSRYGNLQYAAYAFGHDMYCRFFRGLPLEEQRKETQSALAFSRTRFNQWAIDLLEGGERILLELLGEEKTGVASRLWEEDYLESVQAHNNIQVECIFHVLRSFQHLVMGNCEIARECSDSAHKTLFSAGTQGLLPWPEHLLIRFLIMAGRGEQGESPSPADRESMERILRRLRVWAGKCPENYVFKMLLAEAELARLDGQNARALKLYDRAVRAAEEGGFLQWQALANERLALFWEGCDSESAAQIYWQRAYGCYETWGARLKVEALEESFRRQLFAVFPEAEGDEDDHSLVELREGLVKSHMELLRSREIQFEESLKRLDAERQAKELALATARLREEVAQRRAAEEELRESEERFRVVVETSPVLVALLEGQKFVYVNPAGLRMLGFEDESGVLGRAFTDFLPEDQREEELARLAQARADRQEEPREQRFLRTDGHVVYVELSVRSVSYADKTLLMLLAVDVSERKSAQKTLTEAKEQAQAASRSKSVFLANMSHEIRTPLNGVIGMLQLLQVSPLNSDQREFADTALQSSHRLTRLLTDILDLSRVEAGRLVLGETTFDFAETVGAVGQLFSPVAAQKGLEFRCSTDPAIPRRQQGDPLRLQQVISNLVGNAIKFTDSGSVTLEAVFIPAVHSSSARVLYKICDTGLGIEADLQDKLFGAFVQAETDYRRRFQGAGLGLAISRELVSMMGGSICLSSEPGQGTCFYVCIPCREDSTGPQVEPPLEDARGHEARRVLLVEDDDVNRLTLTKMLEALGHSVRSVEDGRSALNLLAETGFDLVLMDIQMPVMDGVQTTQALRSGEAGEEAKNIPVVAMTAYAMAGDRERFLAAEMDEYLSKPVDLKELREVVNAVERGGRPRL